MKIGGKIYKEIDVGWRIEVRIEADNKKLKWSDETITLLGENLSATWGNVSVCGNYRHKLCNDSFQTPELAKTRLSEIFDKFVSEVKLVKENKEYIDVREV